MTITLSDLLKDGKVHVLDGAMGTMLYSKGFLLNVCYDELNLKQPKLVQEVHEAYVRAGAEVLETNTFGANPVKLKSFGLADETEQINQAAARLAHAAAAGRASVVGAIGPLGVLIEPFGALARDEACAHFSRQVKGLLAGSVDGFILETFSDVEELHAALRAVQSLSDLPVIAQMTIGDDGLTHYGTAPETFAQQLAEWGADVIGVNCSVGPAGVLEAVEKLVKATDRPISAVPNAGLPKDVGDRKIYLASPEYMASYARRMIEAGARVVGGCCGTTPEHIKKIRDYVARVVPRHQPTVVSRETIAAPAGVAEVPLATRSCWGAKLARGELVTSVEIVPPKGVDPTPMLQQCRALKAAGVDAVNVPEGPEPDGRAPVGDPDSEGSGDRDRHPLLLPGPQPPRDVVGHPRRARGGAAQHPDHHRRSAEDGPLLGGHRGIRHRLDRPHEPGLSPQPRARPGEQPDRGADPVGDRRRREPRRRGLGPRAVALRVEGGRGSGVRRDTTGVRP